MTAYAEYEANRKFLEKGKANKAQTERARQRMAKLKKQFRPGDWLHFRQDRCAAGNLLNPGRAG